jgi:hypothetical protein
MEEQLHPLIRLLPHTLGHMTVNIQGKAGRGMTQVALHRFDVIAAFQRHHRIAMAQVMEPFFRHSHLGDDLLTDAVGDYHPHFIDDNRQTYIENARRT